MPADNPPGLPRDMGPVTPYMSQRGNKAWDEGDLITIDLGGEHTRGVVKRVLHENILMVEITNVVVSPRVASQYKRGDLVEVIRDRSPLVLTEIWRVLTDSEKRQAILRAEIAQEDQHRAAEAERLRVEARQKETLDARAQSERERLERETRAVEPAANPDNWSA